MVFSFLVARSRVNERASNIRFTGLFECRASSRRALLSNNKRKNGSGRQTTIEQQRVTKIDTVRYHAICVNHNYRRRFAHTIDYRREKNPNSKQS